MVSTVTRSQSNRGLLECGGTGDLHHECVILFYFKVMHNLSAWDLLLTKHFPDNSASELFSHLSVFSLLKVQVCHISHKKINTNKFMLNKLLLNNCPQTLLAEGLKLNCKIYIHWTY